jgi:hypothetical protein
MSPYDLYRQQLKNGVITKPVKEKKPPAKASKKRAKINRNEYGPKAKKYILDNPICNIQMPEICNYFSQCVNHTKGKSSIELLLDERYWEPSCFMCNGGFGIENNEKLAREGGHKISKFKKDL